MRVVHLDGPPLDFWVAKAEGLRRLPDPAATGARVAPQPGAWHPSSYHPSTDWSQGGAITAREWFELEGQMIEWFGPQWSYFQVFCEAPLKWFMRAWVAVKFGDEVEDDLGAADGA